MANFVFVKRKEFFAVESYSEGAFESSAKLFTVGKMNTTYLKISLVVLTFFDLAPVTTAWSTARLTNSFLAKLTVYKVFNNIPLLQSVSWV